MLGFILYGNHDKYKTAYLYKTSITIEYKLKASAKYIYLNDDDQNVLNFTVFRESNRYLW